MNRQVLFLVLIPVSLACLTFSLHADPLDDQVRKIGHQLRCPTCQAMSIKESDAGLSVNMKLKIREMLKEGKSEAEILQFFEERYGEWILRSPKKQGFNLLLWLLPGTIILIAFVLAAYSIRKHSQSKVPVSLDRPLSPEEIEKINSDLNEIT